MFSISNLLAFVGSVYFSHSPLYPSFSGSYLLVRFSKILSVMNFTGVLNIIVTLHVFPIFDLDLTLSLIVLVSVLLP